MKRNKNWWWAVAILMVIGVNLFFGWPRLSRFSAVDEPYWTYGRVSKFWNSIKAHKWSGTDVNDKPGVTVATLSGLGLLSYDPMQYKNQRFIPKTPELLSTLQKINFSFRWPIYIFSLLSLLVIFWLLKECFGYPIAFLSAMGMILSPILLGITLIINPDSLLWLFSTGAILSYWAFQLKKEKKFLIICGFSVGLALLTKYVANILFVYFFALIFLEYIFCEETQSPSEYVKKSSINFLIIACIAVITYWALYPAAWFHWKMVLEGTFWSQAFKSTWPIFVGVIFAVLADLFLFSSRCFGWVMNFFRRFRKEIIIFGSSLIILLIVFVLFDLYCGMKPFNFESILASPKSSEHAVFSPKVFAGRFLADWYALIFALTPFNFILFLTAILQNFWHKKYDSTKRFVWNSLIFIALYYMASTVNHVGATVRYQIALYPLAIIISSIGLNNFLEKLSSRPSLNKKIMLGAIIIMFFSGFWALFSVRPFFFSYASAFFPSQYTLNLKDMGDGSFEAGDYLNNLPDASGLKVWSDKGAVCESFIGRCVTGFTKKDWGDGNFDYLVVSSGRKSRSLKLAGQAKKDVDFIKLYDSQGVYEKRIIMGGQINNFVKIVNGKDVSLD